MENLAFFCARSHREKPPKIEVGLARNPGGPKSGILGPFWGPKKGVFLAILGVFWGGHDDFSLRCMRFGMMKRHNQLRRRKSLTRAKTEQKIEHHARQE